MSEHLEKHGDVRLVVGEPEVDVTAGEACPRCKLVVQEHRFLWPRPERDLTLYLFVEACYCGVRFTDAGSQRLDEIPELWGASTEAAAEAAP